MGNIPNNSIKQQKLVDRKLAAAMVIAVCTAVCAFLFTDISSARYRSEVEGTTMVEPAMFNAVLLGNLPFGEGENAKTLNTGNKLTASINVTEGIQFGAVDLNKDDRKLRPGAVIAIPFTVTNGTTRYADESGDKVGNIAETDIAYTMSLTTTENIPLDYDIYSYHTEDELEAITDFCSEERPEKYKEYTKIRDGYTEGEATVAPSNLWGTKLETEEEDIVYNEAIGYSQTLTVKPEGSKEDDEKSQYFILDREKVNGEEAIDIDRYVLVISWPDGDVNTEKMSTKYMKEIDIIEVRLQVESWTENLKESDIPKAPNGTQSTTALFRIQKEAVKNQGYYKLPEGTLKDQYPNEANVYSQGTVPFYALREMVKEEPKEGVISYYLDMEITNIYDREYVWKEKEADSGLYEAELKASGFEDGKIAIAVPVNMSAMDIVYTIECMGQSYEGKLTDKYITTSVWKKNTELNTPSASPSESPSEPPSTEPSASPGPVELYHEVQENAYRIVEFPQLELPQFLEGVGKHIEARLIIKSKNNITDLTSRDDFKIIIYRTEEASQGEEEDQNDQQDSSQS